MKKVEILALAVILIVAALLRFPLISQGFFAFTYDQGRDLLAVKDIVNNFNLTLIGPTTGLPGIFYGPWWYYFLSPIFAATSGDPLKITLVFALIGITSLVVLFLFIRKITGNTLVALGIIAIASMSQPFITSSSQIWSPSLVTPLMLIYLYSVYKIFQNPQPLWFLTLGLSSGFIADSGAAFGVVVVISTMVASIIFRKQFFQKGYVLLFVGLPVIFMSVIALIFSQLDKSKLKLLLPIILVLIALNFNRKLTSPFSITWQRGWRNLQESKKCA